MSAGVVSNLFRCAVTKGAVKRSFATCKALRSAPTPSAKCDISKCAKICEVYLNKTKEEGKKFIERLASNKFSWKDMAVAIVAIDTSIYGVVKVAGCILS